MGSIKVALTQVGMEGANSAPLQIPKILGFNYEILMVFAGLRLASSFLGKRILKIPSL